MDRIVARREANKEAESAEGSKKALPPAWLSGQMEKPAGEKNHGSHTSLVYTAEQQARLGVDEEGNSVDTGTPRLFSQSSVGGPQSIPNAGSKALPPPWVLGDIEKPAGEKNHGTWTALVYTPEQQARLGVDEAGNKVERVAEKPKKALPPAWVTNMIEKPAGEKNHGTHTTLVYTPEQQARLGVDEEGNKRKKALPPAWLTNGLEKPAGQVNHGTYTTLVYTAEQQERLGVDEHGNKRIKALPPAWISSGLEKPAGEKNHGTYTTLVYTEEQQKRLGVDEVGNKVADNADAEAEAATEKKEKKVQALPPAWLTGRMEKPAGEKNHGTWTSLVYTEEQQQRLGVDENGNKVNKALPPAWIRGDLEKPAGEKHHGTFTTLVYTAEQQARLGVDEVGNKVEGGGGGGGGEKKVQALPPAWLTGRMEKPAGEKNHGTWTSLVYTEEQQERLGVDEDGNKVTVKKALPPAWLSGAIEKPAGEKSHGSWTALVYTPEQQARLGVDEDGNKVEGTSTRGATETVGNTVHQPFAPYPGADSVFNEYITYGDDAALGQPCPDLSSLKYLQGDELKVGDGRVKIVFFWGKYLKWQCWPTMVGMCEINEKHPEVDIVGVAADKKEKDVARFMEKGECRADCALAFDMNWTVKDAFRKVMKVGAMAVPCAFLIDGDGKIVWRQSYSAGYPFATMGLYTQLKHLLAGEPLESHGANPEPEADIDDVEEAKDVFQTQEVVDAIW